MAWQGFVKSAPTITLVVTLLIMSANRFNDSLHIYMFSYLRACNMIM